MASNKRDASIIEIAVSAKPKPLSENTVRRDLRRGAPHERRKGKIFLNHDEYFAWREAQNLTGNRGRPQPNDPEDLAAAKLAKLQEEVRIKRAQADRDERRAEVDRGSHQNLQHLREMLVQLGSSLKSGIDRMQRKHGPQVAVEFNEIIEEFGALVRKHLGRMGDAEDGGAGPTTSDDT